MRRQSLVTTSLVALTAGCASITALIPSRGDPSDRMAAGVTISRDQWGVPFITGETLEHVAFGLGYAQAEDAHFDIEEAYLHALGRASHWYGERFLDDDMRMRAFEVERLSREEYEREPADRRAFWDAYAAGLNYWVLTTGARPRLITHFEPWMPFALVRSLALRASVDGVPVDIAGADSVVAVTEIPPRVVGAVVAPSRSETGRALLLHADIGALEGAPAPYEAGLLTADGWQVHGFMMLGTPVPVSGRNTRAVWAHVPSRADHDDLFVLAVDANDPLTYRVDGNAMRMREWQDTLEVNTPAGVQDRVTTFRATENGPVVTIGGRSLEVRVARHIEGGALQQALTVARAGTVDQVHTALDQRAMRAGLLYADADGSIMYIASGAVPVRSAGTDPVAPMDGSASATGWSGYHATDDLPQVLNPEQGWVSTAHHFGGDYPPYMNTVAVTPSKRADEVLGANPQWSLESLGRLAFDTHITGFEDAVIALGLEWESVGGFDASRARRLDDVVENLRGWDGSTDTMSVMATHYVLWQEALRTEPWQGEYAAFRAMEAVLTRLERDWGATAVPWGEISRVQRRSPAGAFSDERPSFAIDGAPWWTDPVLEMTSEGATTKRRYAVRGVRAVLAAEAAGGGRAAVVFGQSADSASAHYVDQAPLFVRGELRSAGHGATPVSTYRPGEASVR